LSYVWGNEPVDKEIYIPGEIFLVRDNVFYALLRFRKNSDTRGLWVDAICINQNVIPERNQQVALIKEVYSRSFGALIWLGNNSSIARVAFDDMLDDGDPDYCPDLKPETADLLSNPWFTDA
jgi:hypothetical protein